jgi:hypothetical protein
MMGRMLFRIARVVGGVLLLFVNFSAPEEGRAALSPANPGEAVGFYFVKALIAALALWLIYRGLKPAAPRPPAAP